MSKTLYFIAPKAAPAPNVNNDFKPFFAAEIVRAKMITLGEFLKHILNKSLIVPQHITGGILP